MRRPSLFTTLLAGMGVLFVLHLKLITDPGRTPDPTDHIDLITTPLIGAAFCFLNAIFLLGWRRALRLLAIAASIGWMVEEIGVSSGLIFGEYFYTEKLGPKILDVPAVIPLFWFMLIFLAYVISNLITIDAPDDIQRQPLIHDIWVSLLGALIVTAYDLGVDPYLASKEVGAWVWSPPPAHADSYFGIPIRNYYGWVVVSFAILYLARYFDRRDLALKGSLPTGLDHLSPRAAKLVALVPVGFYISFWFQHLSHNYTPPVVIISMISLGIPAMAAVSNWLRWHARRHHQPNPATSPTATTTVVTRTS